MNDLDTYIQDIRDKKIKWDNMTKGTLGEIFVQYMLHRMKYYTEFHGMRQSQTRQMYAIIPKHQQSWLIDAQHIEGAIHDNDLFSGQMVLPLDSENWFKSVGWRDRVNKLIKKAKRHNFLIVLHFQNGGRTDEYTSYEKELATHNIRFIDFDFSITPETFHTKLDQGVQIFKDWFLEHKQWLNARCFEDFCDRASKNNIIMLTTYLDYKPITAELLKPKQLRKRQFEITRNSRRFNKHAKNNKVKWVVQYTPNQFVIIWPLDRKGERIGQQDLITPKRDDLVQQLDQLEQTCNVETHSEQLAKVDSLRVKLETIK